MGQRTHTDTWLNLYPNIIMCFVLQFSLIIIIITLINIRLIFIITKFGKSIAAVIKLKNHAIVELESNQNKTGYSPI